MKEKEKLPPRARFELANATLEALAPAKFRPPICSMNPPNMRQIAAVSSGRSAQISLSNACAMACRMCEQSLGWRVSCIQLSW
jgi:hypothetical protein